MLLSRLVDCSSVDTRQAAPLAGTQLTAGSDVMGLDGDGCHMLSVNIQDENRCECDHCDFCETVKDKMCEL